MGALARLGGTFQASKALASKCSFSNARALRTCPAMKFAKPAYREEALVASTSGRHEGRWARGRRACRVAAQASSSVLEKSRIEESAQKESWEIKMLYDGDCPLCMREVDMLQKRDAGKGKIKFVDIAAEDYDPEENAGISFEQAMGRIHGIERNGTLVTNVEAFRKFYEAVDLGWVYAITKYKPILKVADAVYDVWAKYRLPVTGRPNMETLLAERLRKQEEGETCTIDGRCR